MNELLDELEEINTMLVRLGIRREEIMDILYPKQKNDYSWIDQLAIEYAKVS